MGQWSRACAALPEAPWTGVLHPPGRTPASGDRTPSSGFFRHLNTHAHCPTHTHTHTASLGVDTHMRTHSMFLTITVAHGINILEKHIKRWHCPLHTGGGHLVMQLPRPTTRVSSTRLVCFGECGLLFCFVFWCPCQATSEPSPSPPPPTNQLPPRCGCTHRKYQEGRGNNEQWLSATVGTAN